MGQSDSSLTPEQQLLKLIEAQGGKQQPKSAAAITPSAKDPNASKKNIEIAAHIGQPVSVSAGASQVKKEVPVAEKYKAKRKEISNALSISALWGRLSYVQEQWSSFVKGRKDAVRLKRFVSLTKYGTVCTGVVLAVLLTIDVVNVKMDYESFLGVQPQEMAEVASSKIRTFGSDFFERVKEENVFAPSEKRAETPGASDAGSGSPFQLVEMTKDFKLTGFSYNPEDPTRTYCMIEDLKKAITSFLKVGDSIAGMTVGNIDNEGVTLKYKEEEIKIR